MEAGETFRRSIESHLWVVVSDPKQNSQTIAIVNFSSIKGNASDDRACVLEVNCHPFVTKETFIAYRYAQLKSNRELEAIVGGGGGEVMEPVSTAVLDAIRQAAANSERIPIEVYDLLDSQGLIP